MNKKGFNNIWFIRLISLLFSIFLYFFVSSENSVPLRAIKNQEFASVNVSETISNVPVYLGKTDGEMFVSGVPETVDVRLTGPKNIINQVSSESLRVETEDLTNMQTGSRSIRYLVMDLPKDIDYQVTPSRTIVQISRRESIKQTIEFDVDPQAIADNYQVKNVNINPKEVTLTGTDKIINEIDRVYINITSEDKQDKNFSGVYAIKIVDKNGNLLDVNANVVDVEVEVVVEPIPQEVSLNIISHGEDPGNFNYTYEFLDQDRIIIKQNSTVTQLPAHVDVSGLTQTATLIANIEIPEGVELIGEQEIKVNVIIEPLQEINDEYDFEETWESSSSHQSSEIEVETTQESETDTESE